MARWIRRLRPALLRLALVGLVAAAVWFRQPVTSLVPLPLPPSANAPDPSPVAEGTYVVYPRSGRVIQGVVYRFDLYTHCGLDFPVAVDFDGSFWDPIGPEPASDGSGNPPAGFDNPTDNGTIQLLSHDLAEYLSRSGTVLRFRRSTSSGRTTYLCG